jgi:hypothetical protein
VRSIRAVILTTSLSLLSPLASPLRAQEWRTLDVSRQLHDSGSLIVRVTYGAGKLGLRAATAPVLYQMDLRYDAERTEPVHSYVPETRTLRLGIRKQSVNLPDEHNAGELHVDLSRAVPIDLSLELGAVQADLDLTNLRIDHLKVESGASEATLRFDTANVERMRMLDLQVGAASLRALRLANANAEDIRVQAGVGHVDLDLGGLWRHDIDLTVEVAIGGATVHVPHEIGVRVEMEKFLASFEHDGLVKRGGVYYSDNWDTAPHRLRIKAQTTFGKFELDRD